VTKEDPLQLIQRIYVIIKKSAKVAKKKKDFFIKIAKFG
jgi:hypothetical protein